MEELCIFCQIAKKQMPSFLVYEDEKYLAFMDIFPRVKGHVLVIPKNHYRWVYDVPEFGEYFETANKVAQKIQEKLNSKFVSFVTAGEEVHHAHIHLLPQTGKGISGIKFTEVIKMSKDEIGNLANELKL